MASFSIEAPAEANPLTNRSVFHVLQAATSNSQPQIQSGTKQLQNWETHPGFYSTLQVITLCTSTLTWFTTFCAVSLYRQVTPRGSTVSGHSSAEEWN